MGSDDTHVTHPELAGQEPESASAAKTTPSDGSGEADGSRASIPSSRRHQEQVQNLKDKCEVVDVRMEPEDNLIDEKKAPVKEPQITLDASMKSGCADPTPSDRSGGGDRSGAPCPWSLTLEKQAKNLEYNCLRAFGLDDSNEELKRIENHPWFSDVVAEVRDYLAKLRCLENSKIEMKEAPYQLHEARLLHMAVLMGDLRMVQKILEIEAKDLLIDSFISHELVDGEKVKYPALDLAIMGGESKIVDALLQKNAKHNTSYKKGSHHNTSYKMGSLQLAVLYAREGRTENTFKIIKSLVRKDIDIKAKDSLGYSAFYIAVAHGKTSIVNKLLEWEDKIQLNEACGGGRPPIQIAHEEGFKDIEVALMRCYDVKWYIDSTIRHRQGFVDTSNAILVGAAFIASATFASWLQPPLNYTMPYHGSSVEYVDVEHNSALGSFWVFNSLSFYFAIGTVVLGASSVLPRRQLFITENVKKLSQNLILMSLFLAFSMLFVVIAFGIAGFIVLIPILRYRWYMIGPTILGGIICAGSIGYLFKSLWENLSWDKYYNIYIIYNSLVRRKKISDIDRMNDFYDYHNDLIDRYYRRWEQKMEIQLDSSSDSLVRRKKISDTDHMNDFHDHMNNFHDHMNNVHDYHNDLIDRYRRHWEQNWEIELDSSSDSDSS